MIAFRKFGAVALGAVALTLSLGVPSASAAQPVETLQWGDYQTHLCLWAYPNAGGGPWEVQTAPCSQLSTQSNWELFNGPHGYVLQNQGAYDSECLDSNYSNPSYPSLGAVYADACNGNNTYQNWGLGGNGPATTIQDYQTDLCLDSDDSYAVYTDSCNWNNTFQNWQSMAPTS